MHTVKTLQSMIHHSLSQSLSPGISVLAGIMQPEGPSNATCL